MKRLILMMAMAILTLNVSAQTTKEYIYCTADGYGGGYPYKYLVGMELGEDLDFLKPKYKWLTTKNKPPHVKTMVEVVNYLSSWGWELVSINVIKENTEKMRYTFRLPTTKLTDTERAKFRALKNKLPKEQ